MKKTPYYSFPTYEDNDPQDLRDGYNRSMDLIDKTLHRLSIQLEILKNKE